MKHLITLIFVLSFSWVFGQQDSINVDSQWKKHEAPTKPPKKMYLSKEDLANFPKVEVYPMPPSCLEEYKKLMTKGDKEKAKNKGMKCVSHFFTNHLGDYVIEHEEEFKEILRQKCASKASGRIKTIIDEYGNISEIESFSSSQKLQDILFTKKMIIAMNELANTMKSNGEQFSQAKSSTGEVVRMLYYIPINYQQEIDYRNHPTPKHKELRNKKKLDEYLTDLFAELIRGELIEKLDEEQIKSLKKAKPVVQVSYKINQDGGFEKLEYSLKVGGKAFSSYDEELGNKELSSSDLPEFYPAYENESCETPTSFEDKLEIDINKIL